MSNISSMSSSSLSRLRSYNQQPTTQASSLSRLRSSSFARLRSYNQQPTTQATTPSSPPGHLISPTRCEPQILSMSNLSSLSSSSLSRLRSYKQPPTIQAHSISTNPSSSTTATTPSSSPGHPISPAPSDHPTVSFDLELANHSDMGMPAEWIRIGKVAQPVGLGGFGASITLFVTAPVSAVIHPALYTAYLTVVFLGIFSAIGLSVFSALMKEGPTVGWVQKKLIYFTFCFVSLACILRLQIALSLANISFAAVLVLTGTVLMVLLYLYLFLGIMCQRHTHEPGRES